MIIDAFMFFNELDILEVRLHELNPVVDMFLLVESPVTFSNILKPLYFEENKSRFSVFLPKIKHIIVDDMPEGPDPWQREFHQRKCIIDRGLVHLPDYATALISDLDEIPSAEMTAQVPRIIQERKSAVVFQHFFNQYYVNRIFAIDGDPNKLVYTDGTRAAQVHSWKGLSGREMPLEKVFGGWHMSYMGGIDKIKYKIDSYSHHADSDHQHLNISVIEEMVRQGKVLSSACRDEDFIKRMQTIPFDEVFLPQYLVRNKQKFFHLFA
jgi:beta-1,4-mannosyl-glycoprotein beta-1,4-N-acetylglucosaminyltransferase